MGTGQGDSQVGSTAAGLNAPTDASAHLGQETNQIGMNGFFGGAARLALTTGDGILHIPEGLYDAAAYDLQHPMEIVKTVGGSAAIAATLKTVLPEAGPVGAIAGTAMGIWFLVSSAPGFLNAYKTGLNANTWSEMNASGLQWGDAAGELGVNSLLGYGGYKLGAGLSGRILSAERFDGFADLKQNAWNKATDFTKGVLGMDTRIPTAASIGLQPNFVIDGDRAIITDSIRADHPTDKIAGPVDPSTEMNATVLLRSKASVLRMDRYIARMSDGRATTLGDENGAFQERFGATQESLDALTKFASQHNLTIAESDLRSGKVLLTGKTDDFQNAFNVRLNQYQTDSGTVSGHSGAVSFPKELAPHVRAVLGIDERPVSAPSLKVQYKIAANGDLLDSDGNVVHVNDGPLPDPANAAEIANFIKKGGYLATEIARAQNFPLRSGGEGQSGAFVSLSGGIDLADYNKFFPEHGLEQPKPLGVIGVDGAKNEPNSPRGGDTENALDGLQMQSVAPKAKVDMIIGPNSDQGFHDVFERGIFPKNGEQQKSVISSSWGLAEQKQTRQAVNALTFAYRQAAIRGVQIVAGAGDNGARSNSPTFQPEFPASDPNVTGVGGLKMILKPDGSLLVATTWDEGEHSATGGGVSKIFRLPRWQWGMGVPNNPDTGKPGRGSPDISTNAAKATGATVRVGGSDYVIGGTSGGAPLYGGLLLNINSELAAQGIKPVTPLNPWMYARANNSNIFHDITTGGNHGFDAKIGWDAATGLGWVDGTAMLDAMLQNQTAVGLGVDPSRPMIKVLNFLPRGINTGDNSRTAVGQ